MYILEIQMQGIVSRLRGPGFEQDAALVAARLQISLDVEICERQIYIVVKIELPREIGNSSL